MRSSSRLARATLVNLISVRAIFEGALLEGKKKGLAKEKKEGLEEGLVKGKKESLVDTARNLIKKKYEIDTIVDITGLTVKQVKAIQAGDNLL